MKEIKLTQGRVALVDDDDFSEQNQFHWYAHKCRYNWYATRNIGGRLFKKLVYMHRAILGAKDGVKVDHRDGDGLNNTRKNIRKSTTMQNSANRGKNRNNKSGYKGVSYNVLSSKWQAQIKVSGHATYLGLFISSIDAARAYDRAARNMFGEFAHLNFPDE